MAKTIKNFNNAEILNIIGWINRQETFTEVVERMSIKAQWAFRNNAKALTAISETYNEMVGDMEKEYISDDKSHEVTATNENGEEVTSRVVNDEYVEEFRKKKIELLEQNNEVGISCIDIELVPDGIGFENLNMLSFMIEDDE